MCVHHRNRVAGAHADDQTFLINGRADGLTELDIVGDRRRIRTGEEEGPALRTVGQVGDVSTVVHILNAGGCVHINGHIHGAGLQRDALLRCFGDVVEGDLLDVGLQDLRDQLVLLPVIAATLERIHRGSNKLSDLIIRGGNAACAEAIAACLKLLLADDVNVGHEVGEDADHVGGKGDLEAVVAGLLAGIDLAKGGDQSLFLRLQNVPDDVIGRDLVAVGVGHIIVKLDFVGVAILGAPALGDPRLQFFVLVQNGQILEQQRQHRRVLCDIGTERGQGVQCSGMADVQHTVASLGRSRRSSRTCIAGSGGRAGVVGRAAAGSQSTSCCNHAHSLQETATIDLFHDSILLHRCDLILLLSHTRINARRASPFTAGSSPLLPAGCCVVRLFIELIIIYQKSAFFQEGMLHKNHPYFLPL